MVIINTFALVGSLMTSFMTDICFTWSRGTDEWRVIREQSPCPQQTYTWKREENPVFYSFKHTFESRARFEVSKSRCFCHGFTVQVWTVATLSVSRCSPWTLSVLGQREPRPGPPPVSNALLCFLLKQLIGGQFPHCWLFVDAVRLTGCF